MKLLYVGPHRAVEIAATRQVVEKGVPTEVTDDVAAELVKQKVWEKAPVAKPKTIAPEPSADIETE